ncbi:MAG TPA: substrate-binding domain-containing protein, partial [Jiangellaceae bacterium]|nr:substrate-binding domain-containing protein [Jiangellaceae bacterium]
RVDGLIVVGSRTDPRPSLGRELPVPVVYTYAPSEDPEDLSIICDNVGAGRLAIEHLISCGRTRIAHITGDPGYGASRERAEGALAALEDAGLPLVGEVRFGAWSEGWGRAAAAMLLDQHPDVDAIFCGSDQVARGVMDALRERGRAVPDDIAVMGFDNWEILAGGSRPPLTCVDMKLEEIGRAAARALFAALDGSVRAGTEALPCRVVLRGSTAPLS